MSDGRGVKLFSARMFFFWEGLKEVVESSALLHSVDQKSEFTQKRTTVAAGL